MVWTEMAKMCPVDNNNGIIFESISVGNSYVILSMVHKTITIEQVTSDMLNALREYIAQQRKTAHTPSYVDIQLVVYDQNHEKVVSI